VDRALLVIIKPPLAVEHPPPILMLARLVPLLPTVLVELPVPLLPTPYVEPVTPVSILALPLLVSHVAAALLDSSSRPLVMELALLIATPAKIVLVVEQDLIYPSRVPEASVPTITCALIV